MHSILSATGTAVFLALGTLLLQPVTAAKIELKEWHADPGTAYACTVWIEGVHGCDGWGTHFWGSECHDSGGKTGNDRCKRCGPANSFWFYPETAEEKIYTDWYRGPYKMKAPVCESANVTLNYETGTIEFENAAGQHEKCTLPWNPQDTIGGGPSWFFEDGLSCDPFGEDEHFDQGREDQYQKELEETMRDRPWPMQEEMEAGTF